MKFSEQWKEYRAAFCATFIMAAAGTSIGWTSPSLPYLQGEGSHIHIDTVQASWIGSMMILASTLSALPAAYMADRMGRKATLLFAAAPYVAAWLSVIFATNVTGLYISRVCSGLGYGIIYTVAPMYLGEIASDEVRGSMTILITVMNKLGILSQYTIGPYVSMKSLALLNLAIPVMFFLSFVWLPESPYYYMKKNKRLLAEKSLERLRCRGDVSDEIKKVEITVAEDMKNKGTWNDLIKDSANLKALMMTIALFATQQLCGSAAVIAYAQGIFMDAGGNIRSGDAAIIVGCMQLFASASSIFLVDRLGRRPLLLVSSLGVFIMSALIGGYFFSKDYYDLKIQGLGYVPIFAIVIYIITYSVGLSTVPLAVTSEIFPTNVKSYATSIIQIFVGLSTFTVTFLFLQWRERFGLYVVFWIFSLCSLVGMVYIYAVLPETKGKSFIAIQAHLRNRKERNIESKIDTDNV